MKTPLNVIFSYVLMLLATTASAMSAERVDFESQVKPIFDKYCLECHGEENEEAFRIDVDSDMLLYVNEGHPETSDLYTYMTLDEDDDNIMPPVGHEPRPAEPEIQLVSAWIAQGAQMDGASSASAEDANLAASDAGDTAIADAAAAVSPETQRMYNALGSLHTAAVHLPIGLLLAAGLFALLSLGGSFVMSDCAYYCLWLGMWGAIFATASGWYYSPMEHRGAVSSVADLLDQTQPVFWHRLGAIITTVVAFVLCLFAKGARGRNPDDGPMWKLGVIVLAAAIGWVGHTGGELTYGKDHYKDLNELVETFLSPAQSGTAPKADSAETNDMTDADADEIKIDIQDSNVEEGTFSAPTDI
jgi:uncharacterized membrane protein